MAGFDFLTGGQAPAPGLLDAVGYMDPAQYDAARRSQGMMGLWAGLLQGGGPSLEPRNFGSALGAGLIGQQKFGTEFDEGAQNRATAQAKLAEIDLKKKGYQLAQDYISGKGDIATPAAAATVTDPSAVPDFGTGTGGGKAVASMTANTDLPPEARGFLDTVAGPESAGSYNARWPGKTFSGYDDHPRVFEPGPAGPSSAAGRYQIVATTWDGLNKKYNFSDFKPETQDTAAWRLAEDTYRSRTGGELLTALKEGKLQDVQQMLKGQWGTLNMANYGANLRKYTGGTATAGGALAPGGAIPEFAEGRAGALGGPVPTAMAGGPAAPVPAPLAGAPAGNRPGANLPQRGAGLVTPQDYQQWLATQQPPAAAGFSGRVEPLAGEAAPAGAPPSGPQFASGVLRAPSGAPPIPSTLVAPAPAMPAAPAGAAPIAMPAAPAAPGAAPAPGAMTVTLPAPPALPTIPGAAPGGAMPQPQALPAAPEMPGIPARPVIPGAGAGAAPAVSPQVAAQARRAQGVVLGLTMMGVHVPDFLQKEAGIAIAGRTAAAEAEARQPIELQNKAFEASLTAAQKRWDALTDQQKETLAFQRGLTKDQMNAMYSNIHEQYKSILDLTTAGPKAQAQAEGALPSELAKLTGKTNEELRRDWDKPDKIEWEDAEGAKHTRIATPRELYAELTGAPPPGAPPMAGTPAPVPGGIATPGAPVPGAAAPGTPPGSLRTGMGPGQRAQLEGRAKQALDYTNAVSTEAQQAIGGRADIDVALAQAPNLNWQGPLAAGKQQFNRITQSVLGLNTEHVAAYETAQQMMGGMLRTALRASDPNPTERQQQMMLDTFPTPASSAQGYQQGLRHLQGIADWKVYRQEALNDWRKTHRSDEGFKESFKYSAIPFVVGRMPEGERTQYFAQLYRADPKAYDRLVSQMKETEAAGYNYKY